MQLRIRPLAAMLWLALLFCNFEYFFAVLLAALAHECGHLLAARRLGVSFSRLEIGALGAVLFPRRGICSYRTEWLLAAAGPAASLLVAILLWRAPIDFAATLATISASLALLNLLPIRGLDGGRMLHALCAQWLPLSLGARVTLAAEQVCLWFLFSLSGCLLLQRGEDLFLLLLCAALFARSFLPQKH